MPNIMTVGEFQSKSSKFLARRKNPIIRDIDKLLAAYAGSAGNPRRQLKILILLYVWCKQYLYGGGTRGGVAELLEQVTALLQDPKMELTLTMAHQGARWRDGNVKAPAADKAKSMNQGYRMEPLLPGKGTVGDVQLEHQLKRINTPALRALFEDEIKKPLDDSGVQYTMKQVIHQAEAAMGTAPITEFLDIFVAYTYEKAYATRADFEYCNKDQRRQYLVHIDDSTGKFCQDDQFQIPYTTDVGSGGKGWGLYAFDMNCRLYVKPSTNIADGAFNHSSFLSGKPVISAGAIEIDPGGNLRSVSNESGHYRPTIGDLAHMLAILHDEYNVNLSGVECVASTPSGKTTMDAFACMNIYRNYPKSRLSDF